LYWSTLRALCIPKYTPIDNPTSGLNLYCLFRAPDFAASDSAIFSTPSTVFDLLRVALQPFESNLNFNESPLDWAYHKAKFFPDATDHFFTILKISF